MRVALDLRWIGDSVEGEILDTDGRVRPFSGWLHLLRLLEDLRPPTPASTPGADRR
jgi:hypothetical protein